jgi:hypothetical protein
MPPRLSAWNFLGWWLLSLPVIVILMAVVSLLVFSGPRYGPRYEQWQDTTDRRHYRKDDAGVVEVWTPKSGWVPVDRSPR